MGDRDLRKHPGDHVPDRKPKLDAREYERELARLQRELVKLQEWVHHEGLKVCVLFEGRDAAGKGGTIKRIVERTNPRVVRVVALDKPTATHCQSGGRAAVMAFGLELMGAKEVGNYYSSWSEWGNAEDTPVVKPKAKR